MKNKRTLNVGEYYQFAIDWQKATGRLLLSNERTREDGEEKLRDAQERQELFDALVERGEI